MVGGVAHSRSTFAFGPVQRLGGRTHRCPMSRTPSTSTLTTHANMQFLLDSRDFAHKLGGITQLHLYALPEAPWHSGLAIPHGAGCMDYARTCVA